MMIGIGMPISQASAPFMVRSLRLWSGDGTHGGRVGSVRGLLAGIGMLPDPGKLSATRHTEWIAPQP